MQYLGQLGGEKCHALSSFSECHEAYDSSSVLPLAQALLPRLAAADLDLLQGRAARTGDDAMV